MALASFIILHGNSVLEVTFLEYLFRVVIYLFVLGGIAVFVFWTLGVIGVIRSAVVEKRGSEKGDL